MVTMNTQILQSARTTTVVGFFRNFITKILLCSLTHLWYRHRICARITAFWLLYSKVVKSRLRRIRKPMLTRDTPSKDLPLKSVLQVLLNYRSIITESHLPHALRYRVMMFDALFEMPWHKLLNHLNPRELLSLLLPLLIPALRTLSRDAVIDRLRPFD